MQLNPNKRQQTILAKQIKSKQVVLEELRKTPILQIACQKSGIGRTSYYRWCQEDAEFKKAADEAMAEGIAMISDLSEVQVISLIKEKNFPAISLWLKAHHPKYGNRVEITGNITTKEELTPEQQALVKRALRLASLINKPKKNEKDCK